ncbi:MAG TPA: conjugative transposon protein TraM [Chitinophagaceae bacterium]|nr:conjugative transposon protein TraM [Chitinophagaceae bacterium]
MNNYVKQRKLLLVLPLLAVPFLTMAFWALGGGKEKKEETTEVKGLNLELPDARLKEDKLMDKLSFYEKADKDSLKLEEWMRSDPYFKRDTPHVFPTELDELSTVTAGKYNQRLNSSPYEKGVSNPEDQILQKLKMLETEMSKTANTVYEDPVKQSNGNDQFTSEVNRLEQMLQLNNTGSNSDPEIKQLENTLDKILDIQHPQRVKERSIKNKEAAYVVRKSSWTDTIVKGFYSCSDDRELQESEQNAIEAIIAAHQTIVNGAVVKFRLLNDVYIKGNLVPANTPFSGIATLDGERLYVEIHSIRCGKSIYSVQLDVYDMDGLPGIYIPGTINREVAKETLNNSLTLADMTSLDPSLKAQATATGIGAVKSLVSKKAKLVRVQVKAGYKVLLNNKNQDQ